MYNNNNFVPRLILKKIISVSTINSVTLFVYYISSLIFYSNNNIIEITTVTITTVTIITVTITTVTFRNPS